VDKKERQTDKFALSILSQTVLLLANICLSFFVKVFFFLDTAAKLFRMRNTTEAKKKKQKNKIRGSEMR
jgi:hypothetical protein